MRVVGAEQHRVHQQRVQLVQRDPLAATARRAGAGRGSRPPRSPSAGSRTAPASPGRSPGGRRGRPGRSGPPRAGSTRCCPTTGRRGCGRGPTRRRTRRSRSRRATRSNTARSGPVEQAPVDGGRQHRQEPLPGEELTPRLARGSAPAGSSWVAGPRNPSPLPALRRAAERRGAGVVGPGQCGAERLRHRGVGVGERQLLEVEVLLGDVEHLDHRAPRRVRRPATRARLPPSRSSRAGPSGCPCGRRPRACSLTRGPRVGAARLPSRHLTACRRSAARAATGTSGRSRNQNFAKPSQTAYRTFARCMPRGWHGACMQLTIRVRPRLAAIAALLLVAFIATTARSALAATPLTVAQAIATQDGSSQPVTGYIVGEPVATTHGEPVGLHRRPGDRARGHRLRDRHLADGLRPADDAVALGLGAEDEPRQARHQGHRHRAADGLLRPPGPEVAHCHHRRHARSRPDHHDPAADLHDQRARPTPTTPARSASRGRRCAARCTRSSRTRRC